MDIVRKAVTDRSLCPCWTASYELVSRLLVADVLLLESEGDVAMEKNADFVTASSEARREKSERL